METENMLDVTLGDGMNGEPMADSMDDLFGDNPGDLDLGDVTVALPVVDMPPPPPALLRRLAEMQASGCCTKLAWSNSGSIARISEDGTTVTFRILERHVKTKAWFLSDASKHTISASIGCRFVHLAFNLIGQDLAVVDSVGRVSLYSSSGGNGKMIAATVDVMPGSEKPNELDALVALHWLPQYPVDCRTIYIGPASRSINGWTSQQRPGEPTAVKVHHPADNGRALLYVTRNRRLVLLYHHESWRSAVTSINSPATADSFFTHADLCEHEGGLILVASDTCQCLHLFSVDLNWNASYVPGPNQTQHVKTIAPEIRTTSLASIPGPNVYHDGNSKLVQLSLVPPSAEVADQSSSTSTTLLATFVRAAITEHASHDPVTMLLRWHIESEVPSLHTSFRHLKSNLQTTSAIAPKMVMRRQQPDVISSKIILSVQPKSFGTILACLGSDGTVEFRDRATFELLQSYMETDHVYSLSQSGFSYLPGEHNTDIATSCDGSATVVVRPNNKMDALPMFFAYGWQQDQASGDESSLAEAAIVCLARQYMTMVCANTASDEVLSLLPPSLPEHLQHLFVREAFRLTRHSPDISNLDDKLRQRIVMSESLLPRVFSLQLFLGTSGTGRSLTAQYAWAVLNLRHVVISISHVAMTRGPDSGIPPVDMIASQHGLARWGVDLMIYILDALLSVKDIAVRDLSKPATGTFESYMQENNNPAFLLVLCSYPRTLLKLLALILHRIIVLAEHAKDRARTLEERQHLTQMGLLEKNMPFTFEAFRTCLDHTEVAMHTVPTAAALKPGQHSAVPDLALNVTGKFSDALEQPLRALLISAIPSLLQDADWSKLHFHDCSWLGMSGLRSMKLAHTYDVIKKTPLPTKASVRRCRRCGSLTEDINIEKPREVIGWLLLAQRNCTCMCIWFVP